MNYTEALSYIHQRNDFERSGSFNNDEDQHLLREGRLLEALNNPHQSYSSTLIAGTKGKGSTAVCIEAVLRSAGTSTGLYTQPDLHSFRERIRARGRLISEEEVAALLPEIQTVVEQIDSERTLAPFIPYEITTGLALLYFQHQSVKHAVIEVGIGGRLDATNILQPLVSVIASISYDHMQILGHTLTEIATEKAGIIKQHRPIVTSAQSPEALRAIASVAQRRQAPLIRVGPSTDDPAQDEVEAGILPAISYRYETRTRSSVGQTFTVTTPQRTYDNLELPLIGLHQLENATLALATLEILRASGRAECQWNEATLRQGLRGVRWPARLEIIGHQPTVVVDGAHNTDSMQKLVESLRDLFRFKQLCVVLGINTDKDLPGIVQTLAGIDRVILTQADTPRAATLEQMQTLFERYAPHVQISTAIKSDQAMELAHNLVHSDDLICATGSLYLAAEVLRWAASHGIVTLDSHDSSIQS